MHVCVWRNISKHLQLEIVFYVRFLSAQIIVSNSGNVFYTFLQSVNDAKLQLQAVANNSYGYKVFPPSVSL